MKISNPKPTANNLLKPAPALGPSNLVRTGLKTLASQNRLGSPINPGLSNNLIKSLLVSSGPEQSSVNQLIERSLRSFLDVTDKLVINIFPSLSTSNEFSLKVTKINSNQLGLLNSQNNTVSITTPNSAESNPFSLVSNFVDNAILSLSSEDFDIKTVTTLRDSHTSKANPVPVNPLYQGQVNHCSGNTQASSAKKPLARFNRHEYEERRPNRNGPRQLKEQKGQGRANSLISTLKMIFQRFLKRG